VEVLRIIPRGTVKNEINITRKVGFIQSAMETAIINLNSEEK
jgi:hypothetical protein